ncbi:MAG: DUF2800 domain-containing protein [Clostridia bacterium]|nr:DUF2800 domain-containing protein [Clostridia bacterium]
MKFREHLNLEGLHAFLSPSKYHWINYDDKKLKDTYTRHMAVQKGTELHDFASRCINLNQKLRKSKKSLNSFVNDAIEHNMKSEQPLYYSMNCFGTADAISFEDGILRISDLKTGVTPAHFEQLEIYAALFCLEYGYNPEDIEIELRIYQNDEISLLEPDSETINHIMNKITQFDIHIETVKD